MTVDAPSVYSTNRVITPVLDGPGEGLGRLYHYGSQSPGGFLLAGWDVVCRVCGKEACWGGRDRSSWRFRSARSGKQIVTAPTPAWGRRPLFVCGDVVNRSLSTRRRRETHASIQGVL